MNLQKIIADGKKSIKKTLFCGMTLLTGSLAANAQEGEDCFELFEPNASGLSMANSFLLLTSSYFVYPNEVGVENVADTGSFRSEFEERMTYFGMDCFRYFHSESGFFDGLIPDAEELFTNEDEEIHHTDCVVMSNEDVVIVSYRGSLPLNSRPTNWITNFSYFQSEVTDKLQGVAQSNAFGEIPIWCHSGFWTAADSIYDDVKSEVVMLKEENPSRPVFVTGHSLGGALATISALRLKSDGFDIQGVYTYASPRVGDPAFADAFENSGLRHHRWVHRDDWGPMSPTPAVFTPASPIFDVPPVIFYSHTGTEHFIDRFIEPWDLSRSPHSCLEYAAGIWDRLNYEHGLTFPMWHDPEWEWQTPETSSPSPSGDPDQELLDPRQEIVTYSTHDPDRLIDAANKQYNEELFSKMDTKYSQPTTFSKETDPDYLLKETESLKYLDQRK